MLKTQAPAKSKSRLGRGLSSLISMASLPVEADAAEVIANPPPTGTTDETIAPPTVIAQPSGRPLEVSLSSVRANPHQPRRQFDSVALSELAASLKSTGVIQPIVIRPVDGGYELIAGERRWRAAQLAGLSTIPAVVKDVDGLTQAQMALVENIQRQDLNPLERAAAYRALIDQLGLTQAELAGRLGEDRSTIANHLRLLDLAEPVRALIRDNKLSLGHAKLLAGISDILEQGRLANVCISQDLSVRNLERLIQNGHATPAPPAATKPSAHLMDLEKSITRQLGMRSQVRAVGKKGRGRLTIHYASLEQFDELMGRLGVTID